MFRSPTVVEYTTSNGIYHVRKSKRGIETEHYVSEHGHVWRDADTLERVNIFVESNLSKALEEFQTQARLKEKLGVEVVSSETIFTREE